MRVAIFGYYGFGNLGDEAVLQAMVEHLREALPGVELWVLSGDPAQTERTHRVRSLPRSDLRAVRRLFRSSDLVCSGGGSLFQDVTSWRSPLFYGLLHELARGTPVLVYAQGIGPLHRRTSRAVTRRAMEGAAAITVRDQDSADRLRELGVERALEVVCDPALALSASASHLPDRTLVVCVRRWPGVSWSHLLEALRRAAREAGLQPQVVCLHRAADRSVSEDVAAQLGCDLVVPSSPGEALEAVAAARVVVGMRLHALILAAAARVPFVGLAYDPKVSSFAASMEMPCLAANSVDPPELARHVVALAEDPGASGRLQERVDSLRPLARRPAQLAAGLVGVVC
ncbi:MAG: polysaccharide pyruvyl transferase CsaB [Armatimonadota bacterium]|nr:polysaccharide pyruvyl transferase CsaB [Armatimonadota bacterium]MDR5675170.1 polysaccharide pyruvyl transferase CsaB [Armatimonadota bacterium]MDR5689091.1 polysaccharide pyruvyl transferase CsaB [Armatimonadota bacterium]MDR7387852.1 polysaccharide pyruvyl transferase CsaB [Armatimonadota bacterium]MDR7389737.1 polysaccharide pyruvyl transferase CsaB [Armatimonadota bacterium]